MTKIFLLQFVKYIMVWAWGKKIKLQKLTTRNQLDFLYILIQNRTKEICWLHLKILEWNYEKGGYRFIRPFDPFWPRRSKFHDRCAIVENPNYDLRKNIFLFQKIDFFRKFCRISLTLSDPFRTIRTNDPIWP